MRIFLTFALGFLLLSSSVSAQSVNTDRQTGKNVQQEARLGIGQSLTVSPNPLPISNAILNINAVNVEIYSYKLYNAAGQIVELENLSGRPDISILNLQGAVELGAYFIQFETDAGKVTRKFLVI